MDEISHPQTDFYLKMAVLSLSQFFSFFRVVLVYENFEVG